ncbi:conserved membrane hypothetical protein [Alteromonas sp. 38]|uniref:acyltransferase family protein n=1 Tax=Alteromonas TaxID=226 RepID=UPI0012F03F44|nr:MULTISPECIES: heparan-alpha-glucosaminide N-acetyltransferase [Alteromonas]CAD5263089.1 conserved membrane hypothetical protein [Alteromonas sp. 154]VXC21123.1 conserved membrane hypothetical protein [Alteromonas sp. 38]
MTNSNPKQRLLSLDVFRGLTIIAMIVVNSPNTYGEFSHAHWIGIHFADLVFPFFILIVGVAISLGFKNTNAASPQLPSVLKKVWRRALILFGLGLIVNLFYTHFEQVRILGVLQRISIVYLVCCYLAIYCQPRTVVKVGIGILVGYWVFILLVPAPGLPMGHLERGENIINWVDRFVPGMLWRGEWDPEGLLSTFPAIVTGIMGMVIGRIIIHAKGDLTVAVMNLFLFGFISFCLGCIWSLGFPFIKQAWTSSFVLATGGIGAMLLATMMWYTDIKGCRKGTTLAVIFGANAITAYVLHVIIEKGLDRQFGGISVHHAYESWAASIGLNSFFSATVWIILFVGICFLPVLGLYRKQIFIKI